MSSIEKSIGKEKVIHGIVVKKLPIGAYVAALEELGNMPNLMLEKMYPDKSGMAALAAFKRIGSKEDMLSVLFRAFTVLPREVTAFVARLLDADYAEISEKLTPDQLMDVVAEFWELNNLGNFIKRAKALVMTVK